jgi:hypothetical protein
LICEIWYCLMLFSPPKIPPYPWYQQKSLVVITYSNVQLGIVTDEIRGLTLLQCFPFMYCRHVFARPSGKRCLVVSSNGMTISRARNGSILHRFPSALPNGSKRDISGPASSYSILDCIFHEVPKPICFPLHLVCQLVDFFMPLAFRTI